MLGIGRPENSAFRAVLGGDASGLSPGGGNDEDVPVVPGSLVPSGVVGKLRDGVPFSLDDRVREESGVRDEGDPTAVRGDGGASVGVELVGELDLRPCRPPTASRSGPPRSSWAPFGWG